jgi:DNA-binding NarL/FixJ family response regulator
VMHLLNELTSRQETPIGTDAHRITTLVVDDSPAFVEVICALLELEPVVDVVGRAADGAEAIQAVAQLHPDLVLMDVHMPYMNGLTASILLTETFPSTKVILMSAEDTPQLRADCQTCGAQAFVYKPNFRKEFAGALEGSDLGVGPCPWSQPRPPGLRFP